MLTPQSLDYLLPARTGRDSGILRLIVFLDFAEGGAGLSSPFFFNLQI